MLNEYSYRSEKMGKPKQNYRAIDLYSGIGGWSLGLEMAGIDVVASYEWWSKANQTNYKNNRHTATEIDIRQLRLADIPKDIDIVVGSPPCTQFSFANRGGSGDIEDGLKDIAKFLEVVNYVRPKFWAMENVPRVASIIENEMRIGGRLAQFAHLNPTIQIIDTCEWGVPQRRQRCIVGNFDFNLLNSYKQYTKKRTLGDVILALSEATVVDPNYGVKVVSSDLEDHVIEEFLSPEEERMNREMKTFHPVYNNMAFPDPLDRTARTITATCTRVSRESIVIAAPEQKGRFRRLTVRERGCLQSFPITYQFFGDSYAQKLKMIGNAVPPLFTFHIAQAMLGIKAEKLIDPSDGIKFFNPPSELPKKTRPDSIGGSYSRTRRFRAAIPHLRFKSGVRFELANSFNEGRPDWRISFFFGNSKNIVEIPLNEMLLKKLKSNKDLKLHLASAVTYFSHVERVISSTNARTLQDVWSHSVEQRFHPYDIVDVVGQATGEIIAILQEDEDLARQVVADILAAQGNPLGTEKVLKHSTAVLAGLFVGASANAIFQGEKFHQTNN